MNALRGIVRLAPRRFAAIFAFACAVSGFGYSLSQEVPVGAVRGRVLASGRLKPMREADVTLVRMEGNAQTGNVQSATTDRDGRFAWSGVPAGVYTLSASTARSTSGEQRVTVGDGTTSETTLTLTRSEPDLQVSAPHQEIGPGEDAYVRARGFVDPDEKAGALKVRVFRTRVSDVATNPIVGEALSRAAFEWSEATRRPLPPAVLHPAHGPAPRLILEARHSVSSPDREGFYTERIPVPVHGPGMYLVEVVHGTFVKCACLTVTDTSLTVKRAGRQLVAFAARRSSGVRLAGCTIRVLGDGRQLGRGVTDGRGVCELRLPAKRSPRHLITIVSNGSDEAVTGFGRGEQGGEEHKRLTVFTYTDRPLYRPGQHVFFKGIVRRNVVAGERYAVPTHLPVRVEVRDPTGEKVGQVSASLTPFGSFHGGVDLDQESPSGVFTIIAKVGGETHTDTFTVASYRKPEYTVTVQPKRERFIRDEPVDFEVQARYYFDAPVAGATVHYQVYWQAQWMDEYGGESADGDDYDEDRVTADRPYGEVAAEGDAILDGSGRALIRMPSAPKDGWEQDDARVCWVHVKVTDSGNREVEADGQTTVTAGSVALHVEPDGYLAEPGKPIGLHIHATTYDHKPVARLSVRVSTSLMKWDPRDYTQKEVSIGQPQTVTTDAGGWATAHVTTSQTGDIRIAASAADPAGRGVRAKTTCWVTGDADDYGTDRGDGITIRTDRKRYAAGDTARIMLAATRTGQTAFLTIEGDRVHSAMSLPMTKHMQVVRVPIRQEYGPNVQIAAWYVRDGDWQTAEEWLRVTVPARDVRVSLRPDRAVKPGQTGRPRYQPRDKITYAIRTTDARGRPVRSELSLSVVDESVYALREEDTKAMKRTFYPRREVLVETSHSGWRDFLADGDKTEPKVAARKRFPDTAYWNPAIATDARGAASVSFALPDTLTTWRATAVAHTLSTALGRQTDKIECTKDFLVRVETPRFLVRGDATQIITSVHNNTSDAQTALVHLRATGIGLQGGVSRSVRVAAGRSEQIVWSVTGTTAGAAQVDATAWTPRVAGRPQYTDRVIMTLPVRPHARELPPVYASGEVQSGSTSVTLASNPAAVAGSARLTVRITPSVAGSISNALQYLIGYPYGCVEQTMSRMLPDLLAQRAQRLTHTTICSAEQSRDLKRMVRESLLRLYRFQHKSGGWGWWENDSDDPWMTAYVLYGLAVAKQEGFTINRHALAAGRHAAALMAEAKVAPETPAYVRNGWGERAFLVYALSLSGGNAAARRNLHLVESGKPDAQSLAYAVLARKRLGLPTTAALAALGRAAKGSADAAIYWEEGGEHADMPGDRLATSVALRAILATYRSDPRVTAIVRWLMRKRTGDMWEDTRDTSFVVSALCDLIAARPKEGRVGGVIAVSVNGKPVRTESLSDTDTAAQEIIVRVPSGFVRAGANTVELQRTGGSSTVFYSADLQQTLEADPLGAVVRRGFEIKREYLRLTPTQIPGGTWVLAAQPSGGTLQRGDTVRVRLTLNLAAAADYVIVEDPVPAGCEPSDRGEVDADQPWEFWYSNTDVRDDRVVFFASRVPAGTSIIEYTMRAQSKGTFRALPAVIQAMYQPEVRAETAEAKVVIR